MVSRSCGCGITTNKELEAIARAPAIGLRVNIQDREAIVKVVWVVWGGVVDGV